MKESSESGMKEYIPIPSSPITTTLSWTPGEAEFFRSTFFLIRKILSL